MKLYLAIVSVVAALSSRNDSRDFALCRGKQRFFEDVRGTSHCFRILRYRICGFRNSADIEAHSGTRFGGFAECMEADMVLWASSRLGWMSILFAVSRRFTCVHRTEGLTRGGMVTVCRVGFEVTTKTA